MSNQPRVIVCAVLLLGITSSDGCVRSTPDATKVHGSAADGFLTLKPGMSPDEVVQLIGEPTHKDAAASVALSAVHRRMADWRSELPPAFAIAESTTGEPSDGPDQEIDGQNWLYGPDRNLQIGNTMTLVQFSNAKLTGASRMTVVRPPMK